LTEESKIENKSENRKKKPDKSKTLFPKFNFISAGILLIIIAIAMITFAILYYIWIPSLVCIAGAVLLYVLIYLLDKNKRFSELFQIRSFNLKWFAILLISTAFSLIMLVIYYFLADQSITTESDAGMNFIIYAVASPLLNLSAFFIYFGRKNIRAIEIHKLKSVIYKVTSTFFLALSITAFIFFWLWYVVFPPASILGGTGYAEGPWLTWYDNNPDTNICVTWMTAEGNTNSKLYYGTSQGNLNIEMVGLGDILHKVYLTGLTPKTTYFYKIPDVSNTIYNFTTASDVQEAFKCVVVGDMQPNDQTMIENGAIVANGIVNGSYDFIVQLGDVADSGGDPDDWHKVLGNIATMASGRPFQASIGNHDWAGVVGSSNWKELFTYDYVKPNLGRFYSFDYHNAHFVMIDNFERLYKMSQVQLNWIKEDIANAKSRGQDWIFCTFHLSMITTGTSGNYVHLQKALIPIFDEYDVDAVFYAHDHDYQHYNLTYGENNLVYDPSHVPANKEIHYFCSGGGGANLEVSYGILNEDRMKTTDIVEWWDLDQGVYRTIEYQQTQWDSTKFLTHSGFVENYSSRKASHEGKYYYYLAEDATYNEYGETLGFEYGEQAYHFIEISIDDNRCNISVKYPNGVLLKGPGDAYPQHWEFTK